MATIETVLGSSQELDGKSIVYLLVEKAARKVPAITANFLMNAERRYVAAEIPENLIQLITDAVAETEKGLANLYMEDLEVWNRKQREILEEYKLEQEINEEAARKSPVELIFDALESKGKPIDAFRTDYRKLGRLSELKTGFLLKFLSQVGIDDEFVHEDVKAMLNGSELIDEDRTWDILVKGLGVKAHPPEKPVPEIKLRNVPPLIEELEAVVTAACKRQPIEGVTISSDVWAEIGIDASAVYTKVAESVLQLNNNHFFVKVMGIGETAGSIRIVELDRSKNSLKAGTPRQLRGNLRLPTEIVDDFYKLFIALAHTYTREIDENPELSKLPYDEKIGISTIILERILKGKTDIAISVYPDISRKKVEECREKYGGVAEAIATRIEKGEDGYAHFNLDNKVVISASEVQGVMNYLADLVPEGLYLLRNMWIMMQVPKKHKKNIDRAERNGSIVSKVGRYKKEEIYSTLKESKEIYGELSAHLSHLAEGARHWPLNTPHELDFRVIEFYGLNRARAAAKI